MIDSSLQPVNVAGTPLSRYFHICAFFDSRDQEYSLLGTYYKEGLDGEEKALHIVDAGLHTEHRERLGRLGVTVERCEHSGQLDILSPEDTYLERGEFDPDKMLLNVERILAAARGRGYPRTRIMGNMGWALRNAPGSDRLIEYEARVNDVLARMSQPAICVYDAAQLSGAMMLDILRSHPLTLANGVVHENPFFTPPEVFLEELRGRTKRRPSAS